RHAGGAGRRARPTVLVLAPGLGAAAPSIPSRPLVAAAVLGRAVRRARGALADPPITTRPRGRHRRRTSGACASGTGTVDAAGPRVPPAAHEPHVVVTRGP